MTSTPRSKTPALSTAPASGFRSVPGAGFSAATVDGSSLVSGSAASSTTGGDSSARTFKIGDARDEDIFGHRDYGESDPRDERGVVACWTVRGCHGIWGVTGAYMEEHCPHNIPDRYSPCPATCAYTRCQRPWHQEAVSLDDLLDPDVDRMKTIKEQCRHCLYFIKHGPRAHDMRSSR